MTKPDKNVEDALERPQLSRHAIILARDERALAVHQDAGNERKTNLFDLKEYQQDAFHFPQ